MIEFQGVNKVFRKERETIHILKDVSFKIDAHDVFGVIGYSGTGRSTLVRLVNQLEQTTEGHVIVDEHDINIYSEEELRSVEKDIGMIFQRFNLLSSKTVFKNVAVSLVPSHKSNSEIKEKVEEILEFVGLADKKNQFPDKLSGGQKQRAAIARALVTSPKVLLCDKATSTLDPATTSSTLRLLENVNEAFEVTTMVITYRVSVVQKICNRVTVMGHGEVVEIDIVKDVFGHPRTKTAQNFVSVAISTESSKVLRASFEGADNHYTDCRPFLDEEQIDYPLMNELINQYGFNVNILFSPISDIQGGTICYLWLRFKHDAQFNRDTIESYFNERHIHYKEVR